MTDKQKSCCGNDQSSCSCCGCCCCCCTGQANIENAVKFIRAFADALEDRFGDDVD